MKAISESGWWMVNLVFETQDDQKQFDWEVTQLRISISVRCEHWREAFWKARRFGIDLGAQRKIRWMGIYNLAPLQCADAEFEILSEMKINTKRERNDIFESCASERDLAEAADELGKNKDLNPDDLDSGDAEF